MQPSRILDRIYPIVAINDYRGRKWFDDTPELTYAI